MLMMFCDRCLGCGSVNIGKYAFFYPACVLGVGFKMLMLLFWSWVRLCVFYLHTHVGVPLI